MASSPQRPADGRGGRAAPLAMLALPLVGSACLLLVASLRAQVPEWWLERGLISANAPVATNDFAVANLGQLKHAASLAAEELEANLPGGAGSDILDMVAAWTNAAGADDFAALNLGQLKATAKPFYDRIIAAGGWTNGYPWTTNTVSDDADFAPANLGQLKHAFAFEAGPGIPTEGLRLWLRADSGVTTNAAGEVGLWEDRSTNASHAAQATAGLKPLLVTNGPAGGPAVRFDGADDFMDLGGALDRDRDQPLTVFAVCRMADGAPASASILAKMEVSAASRGHDLLHLFDLADGAPKLRQHLVRDWSTGDAVVSDYAVPEPWGQHFNLLEASYDGSMSAGGMGLGWDGMVVAKSMGSGTGPSDSIRTTAPTSLGARGGQAFFFAGDIAEVIAYDRILSPEELAAVQAYAAARHSPGDSDWDGLPDEWELRYFDDLSHGPGGDDDLDGPDGLTNAEEFALGTDPSRRDTDGDWLDDGEEAAHGTAPLVADSDGDTIPDGREVNLGLNPTVADDLESDTDADGLTLGQELLLCTDPGNADSDGDGTQDGAQYSPVGYPGDLLAPWPNEKVGENVEAGAWKYGYHAYEQAEPQPVYLTKTMTWSGDDEQGQCAWTKDAVTGEVEFTGDLPPWPEDWWEETSRTATTRSERAQIGVNADNSPKWATRQTTITEPSTTAVLRQRVEDAMPAFSGNYLPTFLHAELVLDPDELHFSIRKMRYRFEFDAVEGLRSTAPLSWVEIFVPYGDGDLAFSGALADPDCSIRHCGASSATAGPFEIDPAGRHPSENGCDFEALLDIAVDANRDGFVRDIFHRDSDPGTGRLVNDSSDRTSCLRPFRFWVNNDQDDKEDEKGETAKVKVPDCTDGTIKTMRDLEDFSPLTLCVGRLAGPIAAGMVEVGLTWRNTGGTRPAIRVFPKRDPYDQGSRYLADAESAALYVGNGGSRLVAGGAPTPLPASFLVAGDPEELGFTDLTSYLIFEGVSEGKGELVLTIDGQPGPGVWIEIMDVKRMYQRAKATPDAGFDPPYGSGGEPQTPNVGFEIIESAGCAFDPPADEEPKSLVFVHGWDMTMDDYHSFSETMFKRLWHQGYRGRFCAFRWPTISGGLMDHYNTSEHRAWKYGPALAAYVASQPGHYATNIAAHSMGNIVAGSALLSGMAINNYALMQAAVPAGCYDASEAVNSYGPFEIPETSHPTPDWAEVRGYRARLAGVTGNLVSFYNSYDYALVRGSVNWELNQIACKPNVIERTLFGAPKRWYGWYPQGFPDPALANRAWFYDTDPVTERWVHDHHESMSFIARPHSQAVGARAIQGCAVDSSIDIGPDSIQGFTEAKHDHSGQFNRPIQQVDDFYRTLASRLGLFPEE